MKAQTIFIPIMLACSLQVSGSTEPTTAQKYPFSDLDKELFFNYETGKMESPYSTASVKTFSKDSLITIEEDAYNKLHAYASKRSEDMVCAALQDARNTPQENYTARQFCKRIGDAARKNGEQFRAMQTTGCHSQRVQLSPHDLVHLLQWSNSIATVWGPMTGSSNDFALEIKLGDTILYAPSLLKKFIIDNGDHEQGKQSRWADEKS